MKDKKYLVLELSDGTLYQLPREVGVEQVRQALIAQEAGENATTYDIDYCDAVKQAEEQFAPELIQDVHILTFVSMLPWQVVKDKAVQLRGPLRHRNFQEELKHCKAEMLTAFEVDQLVKGKRAVV